ncbi:MAG: hypothetical protein HYT10_03295 [Candidatus Levybacteria bacterium]|nr:hypothetical protein [Candidatus Levybacteria bacterium]
MSSKKSILLIVFVGILFFANALFNGFVYDDEGQLLKNSAVHSLANIPQLFTGSTYDPGGSTKLPGLYYKPLMPVFFTLLYSIFGPQPFWFHFFQIFLHIGNALLLNLLLVTFVSPIAALIASLIFLLHPANSEVAIYSANLQDVLFVFFGLLSLHAIRIESRLKSGGKKLALQILIPLLLLFSLLSKETGIIFFALGFLYLFLFKRKRLLVYVLSASAALIVYAWLRLGIAQVGIATEGVPPIMRTELGPRLLHIPFLFFLYLLLFFFPKDLAIGQQWILSEITLTNFWLPLAIVTSFLLGLRKIYLLIRKKDRKSALEFLFFFSWFLLGITLHLQIFPLDFTFADRWFYIPMIGLLGMGAISFSLLILPKISSSTQKDVVLLGCLVILLLLGLRTIFRNSNFKDNFSLYSHDIQITKNSYSLENSYGIEISKKGDINEAQLHFKKSVELAPQWWTNWFNLGLSFEKQGNIKEAEKAYIASIKNGNPYFAYEQLAKLYLLYGSKNSALAVATDGVSLFPNNPRLFRVLALTQYELGLSAEATESAKRSYMLEPNPTTQNLYELLRTNHKIRLKETPEKK